MVFFQHQRNNLNFVQPKKVKFSHISNCRKWHKHPCLNFYKCPPVGVRVHTEIKYRLSNRREGNWSQTNFELPVCSPFSFLGNFFHYQLPKSKAQISWNQRQFKLNILYQTISNTTKKICTFHLQIIEANSEIIARAERIFLKFQHNFLRVTFVFQVLVLFQSNLSHLNFFFGSSSTHTVPVDTIRIWNSKDSKSRLGWVRSLKIENFLL